MNEGLILNILNSFKVLLYCQAQFQVQLSWTELALFSQLRTYAAHPSAYAAHPSAYAAHPSAYAAYPSAYAAHPSAYAAHPSAYAAHPSAYAAHPSAYAAHPGKVCKRNFRVNLTFANSK